MKCRIRSWIVLFRPTRARHAERTADQPPAAAGISDAAHSKHSPLDWPVAILRGARVCRAEMRIIALSCGFCALVAPALAAPLADRIGHYVPEKAQRFSAVHGGAGSIDVEPILDDKSLSNNLLFWHRGVIEPYSGIGEHFHNRCEEMFVILSGEAEFTINGRTSLLKAPVGAPDRMGSAHAIYNPTDQPVEWMNINVGTSKVYDTSDLGDSRVGAAKDPIAQFITMRLDRADLKPVSHIRGIGLGRHHDNCGRFFVRVGYRQLDRSVFCGSAVFAGCFARLCLLRNRCGSICIF